MKNISSQHLFTLFFLFFSLHVFSSNTIVLAQTTSATSHHQLTNQQTAQSLQNILSKKHTCSSTLSLRSQAMSKEQEVASCKNLGESEKKFHRIFQTDNKPVAHDMNTSLRANIYQTKEDYVKYASSHFNMSTDNGGMYLEGLPDVKGNHAEFIAYQNADGSIKNLGHEYVHYLDGRFNLYGDFCANLQDTHSAPENCAKPSPLAPYLVWWTEGIAEYISRGADNAYAIKLGKTKAYALSQLFDTAYESNNGRDRIYAWGYLATRFMMEKHRDDVEVMLQFTRKGDYPRYQALVRSWGTSLDAQFALWLDGLE